MNKDKIAFFIFVLCVFAIVSCNNNKQKSVGEGNILKLDIRGALDNAEKKIYLSDLTKKIKYIPLETHDSCLLIAVNKPILTRNYIFISDSKKLMQFDRNGNFIQRIGATGRGPAEQSSRIKFSINEINGESFIFSSGKIDVYNIETGKFIRRFKVNFDVSHFEVLTNGNLLFFTHELPKDGPVLFTINEIYITDNNGGVIDSIANNNRIKNRSNALGFANYYWVNSDKLRYMYNFRDTLYDFYSDCTRTPYAAFNFGNKLSRDKIMVEPANNETQFREYIWIPKIFETNKFILTTIQRGINHTERDLSNLLYNKSNRELFLASNFINDIDGGLDFWPNFSFENTLLAIYYPYQIIEYYESNLGSKGFAENFVKLVDTLQKEDNPILVLIEE